MHFYLWFCHASNPLPRPLSLRLGIIALTCHEVGLFVLIYQKINAISIFFIFFSSLIYSIPFMQLTVFFSSFKILVVLKVSYVFSSLGIVKVYLVILEVLEICFSLPFWGFRGISITF